MTFAKAFCNLLTYDTVRYARIRHSSLGLVYYTGCLAIGVYIVYFQILLYHKHLATENARGYIRFWQTRPTNSNCKMYATDCNMEMTPDKYLPYCERFVKLKDGDTLHGNVSRQLPCLLMDELDAASAPTDNDEIFIPTRESFYAQRSPCMKQFVNKSKGFGVEHKSYFCAEAAKHGWDSKKTWEGYIMDAERFRVIILHGMSTSNDGHFFPAHKMQGFVQHCEKENSKGEQVNCRLEKIRCVHARCGCAPPECRPKESSWHDFRKEARASSSLSEVSQGISDHNRNDLTAASSRKHKLSSRKSKLQLGLHSSSGFLEFIQPDVKANRSFQSTGGPIKQDVNAFSDNSHVSHEKEAGGDFTVGRGRYRHTTWSSVGSNLEGHAVGTVDLDHEIVQGQFGLVTSLDYLLELAGIGSLDEPRIARFDNSLFIPRDNGINLKITFDYSNGGDGIKFFPDKDVHYVMKVKRYGAERHVIKKRDPGDFSFEVDQRREIHMTGVLLRSIQVGEYMTFDFGNLLIVLTSAVGLYAAMVAALDFVAEYLYPGRFSDIFSKFKYERTFRIRSVLDRATNYQGGESTSDEDLGLVKDDVTESKPVKEGEPADAVVPETSQRNAFGNSTAALKAMEDGYVSQHDMRDLCRTFGKTQDRLTAMDAEIAQLKQEALREAELRRAMEAKISRL